MTSVITVEIKLKLDINVHRSWRHLGTSYIQVNGLYYGGRVDTFYFLTYDGSEWVETGEPIPPGKLLDALKAEHYELVSREEANSKSHRYSNSYDLDEFKYECFNDAYGDWCS